MNEDDTILQAIKAIQGGRNAEARGLLAQVLKTNPYYDTAWVWMAEAVEEPERKRECLHRALAINPVHDRARYALKMLDRSAVCPPPASNGTRARVPAISTQCRKCGAPLPQTTTVRHSTVLERLGTIQDVLDSARYVTDSKGQKTEVLVPLSSWNALLASWEQLVEMLENQSEAVL